MLCFISNTSATYRQLRVPCRAVLKICGNQPWFHLHKFSSPWQYHYPYIKRGGCL